MPFKPARMNKDAKGKHIYFELFDKYFDSFAVSFACNVTYIFGSVVTVTVFH